jgi:serine/threonine protein kinase/tetratricopeptide (TPR) repeat protein
MCRVEPALPVLGPGTFIGPYVVIERLGLGGMGEVFLARDSRLQRKVALKYLTSEKSGDETRATILREARAAARINHPNVAAVHDVFDESGRTFIVMEYVGGESLAARLGRERLPIGTVISIGRQLAAGLAAAHAEGIIHRDLKPANVQLTPEGSAKILDFGVARATASILSTTTSEHDNRAPEIDAGVGRPGTPAYMSPEQKLALPIDERSDIYSLGLVLFEMAAGRRAAVVDTIDLAFGAALPPPRPDAADAKVPAELATIIERALEPDPRRRFNSAAELESALAAIDIPVEPDSRGSRISRRTWIGSGVAAMAILSIAIAGIVRGTRHETLRIRSLAVLPLANDSHDPRQDYLADGITDGLINTFGQIGALKVTARTSSMQFRNTTKSVAQIARELNVDAVLEGSIMIERIFQDGERVRIALNLIDPATQQQIWSETLDRELGSVLALQTDIARSVAQKINVVLTREEGGRLAKPPQVNPEAFKLYLLGRQRWNSRTVPGLREALDFFRQALALDPTYAPAHAGVADSYALLAGDFGAVPRDAGADAATASALRAIALDPSLAEAHASLAFTDFFLKWNWTEAEKGFRRAIELNPSYATAHQWFGNFLSDMGREEEGLAEMKRAQTLDPLSPIISRDVAWPLFFNRRYDEAIQQLQSTLSMHPDYVPAERLLARAQAMGGQSVDAVSMFERLRAKDATSRSRCELAWAYALAGRHDDAMRELERARAMAEFPTYPYDEALVLTALGRITPALDALDRAYAQRDPTLVNVKHDPRLDALHSDPRYSRLLALMRFP